MIAALLLAAAAASTPTCAPSRPTACANINALALSPGFRPLLRRFFGRAPRASLLYPNGTLADQAVQVLHGPPDPPARIGRLFRFTACRAHSCPEKGALVLTPAGEPIAVAILHSPCAYAAPPPDCSKVNLLAIYTRRVAQGAVVADLTRWAQAAVTAQSIANRPPGVRVVRLG